MYQLNTVHANWKAMKAVLSTEDSKAHIASTFYNSIIQWDLKHGYRQFRMCRSTKTAKSLSLNQ